MSNAQQQQLPGVRDWSEPQTVRYGELGAVIVQAAIDGFEAIRMDTITGGYRLKFVRMDEETKPQRKAFPSFAELSQPPEP
jgi:hypothetical protein